MSVTVRRAGVEDITALASLRWTRRVDEMDEQPWGSRAEYLDSMRQWWATHPTGMLGFVAELARTENCGYLAVHPSPRSTSFYERCGYATSEGLLELRLDRR